MTYRTTNERKQLDNELDSSLDTIVGWLVEKNERIDDLEEKLEAANEKIKELTTRLQELREEHS